MNKLSLRHRFHFIQKKSDQISHNIFTRAKVCLFSHCMHAKQWKQYRMNCVVGVVSTPALTPDDFANWVYFNLSFRSSPAKSTIRIR